MLVDQLSLAPLPPTPATVSFNVTSGSNSSIVLLLEVGMRIKLNSSKGMKEVDVPADAKVSGGSESGLTLTFSGMVMSLTFGNSDDFWDLSNMTLTSGKDKIAVNAKDENGILSIHAHKNNAFKCIAAKEVTEGDLTANIVNLKVQPFMAGGSNEFSKAEICEEDKIPNNVVPIAVGAALAALVVIVLVMYLIGRRKHGGGGYQTV